MRRESLQDPSPSPDPDPELPGEDSQPVAAGGELRIPTWAQRLFWVCLGLLGLWLGLRWFPFWTLSLVLGSDVLGSVLRSNVDMKKGYDAPG